MGIAALEDAPPVVKAPLKDEEEALVGIAALEEAPHRPDSCAAVSKATSAGENASVFWTLDAGSASSGDEGTGESDGGGSGSCTASNTSGGGHARSNARRRNLRSSNRSIDRRSFRRRWFRRPSSLEPFVGTLMILHVFVTKSIITIGTRTTM